MTAFLCVRGAALKRPEVRAKEARRVRAFVQEVRELAALVVLVVVMSGGLWVALCWGCAQ
jgi:hypothetical protein